MLKIITFCRTGEAISDFKIQEEVKWILELSSINMDYYNHFSMYGVQPLNYDLLKSNNLYFYYSTHLILDEISAQIAEGTIDSNNFEFWVEDNNGDLYIKEIDTKGRSTKWFDSECVADSILERIIRVGHILKS